MILKKEVLEQDCPQKQVSSQTNLDMCCRGGQQVRTWEEEPSEWEIYLSLWQQQRESNVTKGSNGSLWMFFLILTAAASRKMSLICRNSMRTWVDISNNSCSVQNISGHKFSGFQFNVSKKCAFFLMCKRAFPCLCNSAGWWKQSLQSKSCHFIVYFVSLGSLHTFPTVMVKS